MKLEQITAQGLFAIEQWDQIVDRDILWGDLRSKCAEAAADKGMALAEQPDLSQTVIYLARSDGPHGEEAWGETTPDKARFVRLTLAAWAKPI